MINELLPEVEVGYFIRLDNAALYVSTSVKSRLELERMLDSQYVMITRHQAATQRHAKILQEGIYAFSTCLTSIPIARLSDRHGRKFILLTCASLAAICNALFGLSFNYPMALGLRALTGFCQGIQPVIRTVLSEITDNSNEATAFALNSCVPQRGIERASDEFIG